MDDFDIRELELSMLSRKIEEQQKTISELSDIAVEMLGDLMVAVSTWESEGHTISGYRQRLMDLGISLK